jgi:mannosyltransferase
MKILYDDIIFRLQKVGGISNVFSQLINFANKDESVELGYICTTKENIQNFYWSKLNIPKPKIIKNIHKYVIQFIPFLNINADVFSIFHATYYNFPLKKNKIIFVITIHDLGYERGIMQKGIRRFINIFFKRFAIFQADGIICVSQSTLDDLYVFYGKQLKNKQVVVIHNGISNNFKNLGSSSSLYSKNILFVGGRQSYKNFEDLVTAISFSEEFNLVILGGGEISDYQLNFINNNIPNRFSIYKNISEQELNQFYNESFCLVYPSSYEGFGLPILESMAAGCPVIACCNSSIGEISGGNAVLIPSSDPQDIYKALSQLKDNEFRSNLILKGMDHAKKFNWDLTYEKTKSFYKKLINLKKNNKI